MNIKEHLTQEGLQKIVAIKASMNKDLSDELKEAFPNIIPVSRPLVVDQEIKDPKWVSGFTSGEGCFFINIKRPTSIKLRETVGLEFIITQHSRDEQLIKSLISYFGCGKVYSKSKTVLDFKFGNLKDINEKIIPFFKKHTIIGCKALDFNDWYEAAELLKKGAHLTKLGLHKIIKIKSRINKRR